ncbi:MAG: hypothetical protein ABIA04_01730 [Pseudomonadota bacterium]
MKIYFNILLLFFVFALNLHPNPNPNPQTCPYEEAYILSDKTDPNNFQNTLEGNWDVKIAFSKLNWLVRLIIGISEDIPAKVRIFKDKDNKTKVKACMSRAKAAFILKSDEKKLKDINKFLNFCDEEVQHEKYIFYDKENTIDTFSFFKLENREDDEKDRLFQVAFTIEEDTFKGRIFNCDGNLKKFGIPLKGVTLIQLLGQKGLQK